MQSIHLEILDLINQGIFNDALVAVNNLQASIAKDYLTIRIHREQGKVNEGLRLSRKILNQKAIEQLGGSEDFEMYLRIIGEKAYIEYLSGLYLVSLSTLEFGNILIQKDKYQFDGIEKVSIFFEFTRANVEASRGNLTAGIEKLQHIFRKLSKSEDKRLLSFVLNDLGSIYYQKGNLKQAIQYFSESLKLKEEIGNPHDIAFTLNNIGSLYYNKGELEKAESIFQRGLKIFDLSGNHLDRGFACNLLGLIAFSRGNYPEAIKYLEEGYTMREYSGNEVILSANLLNLIIVKLTQEKRNEVEHHLSQMKELIEQSQSPIPELYYAYAEGILNKKIPTMRSKVKAVEIFKNIISSKTTNFEIVFNSMYHLCDLYIEEFTIFQNETLYMKAKELVNEIVEYARSTNSNIKIIEALILESKFEIIDGNYETAVNILEHACLLAEQQELTNLYKLVNKELERIEVQLDEWRTLLQKNSTLMERITTLGIKDYLTTAGLLFHQGVNPYSSRD